jgi:hypothetical protein
MTNTDNTRLPNTGAGYDYPVPLRTLPQGARFACYTQLDGVWGLPDRIEFGTLLWAGTGSTEIWWDHESKSSRCTPELLVYIMDEETLSPSQMHTYGPKQDQPQGELSTMTTTTAPSTPTSPTVMALIARFNFQLKALVDALEGDDKAKAQITLSRLEKAIREAAQLHVKLPDLPVQLQTYEPLLELLSAEDNKAKEAAVAEEQRRARHADTSERTTNRAVAIEKHINETKTAKKDKSNAPKTKAEKKQRPCLDGCGTMVGGNFAMGHDAKLKSLLIKIERGEMPLDAIPEPCLDLVKIVKGEAIQDRDSSGNPKGEPKQTYRITAAPVRFPGRDDVQLTRRED